MTTSFALLGSTTLGGAASSISITFGAKKYLLIEAYLIPASSGNVNLQFNSDTSTNYADRYSYNGGADATDASNTAIKCCATATGNPQFIRVFINNIAAQEKLVIGHLIDQGTAGAANVSNRQELVGKWTNISNQISTITFINFNSLNFSSGSTITVYGSD